MSEPGLKCEYNVSFKQIFSRKLFIAFEMAYSCCSSFRGNLDFPEFLQKKFYNINFWIRIWILSKVAAQSSDSSTDLRTFLNACNTFLGDAQSRSTRYISREIHTPTWSWLIAFKVTNGKWQWLSWQSGNIRYLRSAVQNLSSATFYNENIFLLTLEKTRKVNKERGREWPI